MQIEKINIQDGDFTYGQRIQLGRLFAEPKDEYTLYAETIKILHDYDVTAKDAKELVPYFNEIVEGLKFWFEKEATMLDYKPTLDELSAGITEYAESVGEMGTIKSLAKAYSQDIDMVLEWKYHKTFGILFTDLCEYRYKERYDKVMERKSGK